MKYLVWLDTTCNASHWRLWRHWKKFSVQIKLFIAIRNFYTTLCSPHNSHSCVQFSSLKQRFLCHSQCNILVCLLQTLKWKRIKQHKSAEWWVWKLASLSASHVGLHLASKWQPLTESVLNASPNEVQEKQRISATSLEWEEPHTLYTELLCTVQFSIAIEISNGFLLNCIYLSCSNYFNEVWWTLSILSITVMHIFPHYFSFVS